MLCSSKGIHCLLSAPALPKGSAVETEDDAVSGKIAFELFGFLYELILPLLIEVVTFLPLLLLVLVI